jgi:uncharacterized protein YegL
VLVNELEAVKFADNPDPRCPLVLALDVSGSMTGAPIAALNEGLQLLKSEIMADPVAPRRVEVAIVAFGDRVETVHEFVTVAEWEPPTLVASGTTPMGEALNRSLDLIDQRKQSYRANAIQYYRPWIFMITDGQPTDPWEYAAERLKAEERREGTTFFAVGVEGADLAMLSQLSVRPPLALKGLAFRELFRWLSASQRRVSTSRVGEQVALPPIDWTAV